MNSNPDLGLISLLFKIYFDFIGSFWKGRILLALSCSPEENLKLDSMALAPKVMEQFKKSDNMEWFLNAEVFFGLSFPHPDDKYSIQVRWADFELNFEKMVFKFFLTYGNRFS